MNAWLLLLAVAGRLDEERLEVRCRALDAIDALSALRRFAALRRESPADDEEVLAWAQRGV